MNPAYAADTAQHARAGDHDEKSQRYIAQSVAQRMCDRPITERADEQARPQPDRQEGELDSHPPKTDGQWAKAEAPAVEAAQPGESGRKRGQQCKGAKPRCDYRAIGPNAEQVEARAPHSALRECGTGSPSLDRPKQR